MLGGGRLGDLAWSPEKLFPGRRSVGCIFHNMDAPSGANDPYGPQIVVADFSFIYRDQVNGATGIGLPLGVENDPVAPVDQGDRVFAQDVMTPNVGHFQFRVGSVLDAIF